MLVIFCLVIPQRSSLTLGKPKKLSLKLCGPFDIVKRIGLVAYEMKLPEARRYMMFFHVNLLKSYVSDLNPVFLDHHNVSCDGNMSKKSNKLL